MHHDIHIWSLDVSLTQHPWFKCMGLHQASVELDDKHIIRIRWIGLKTGGSQGPGLKNTLESFFLQWIVRVWECNVCLRCCKSPQMLPSFTVWLHSISNSSWIPGPCASIQGNKILLLWLIALSNYTFNTLIWRHFFRYELMHTDHLIMHAIVTVHHLLLWLD